MNNTFKGYKFGHHKNMKQSKTHSTNKQPSWFNTLLWGGLFFLGLFLIMNFQAYKTLVVHYFNSAEGEANVFAVKSEPATLEESPLYVRSSLAQSLHKRIKVDIPLDMTAPDNRLVIPRLNLSVPIQDVDRSVLNSDDPQLLNDAIQNALQNGVVHYPGTAVPGRKGNTFITGHSSYYLWDPGSYKDVFALLPELVVGDDILIYFGQNKFHYKVKSTKEVWPNQVDVLNQTDDYRLTLMTCTPIGTNLRRLIVTSELQK